MNSMLVILLAFVAIWLAAGVVLTVICFTGGLDDTNKTKFQTLPVLYRCFVVVGGVVMSPFWVLKAVNKNKEDKLNEHKD